MLVTDPFSTNIFKIKEVGKKTLMVSRENFNVSQQAFIKTMAQKVVLLDRIDYTRLNRTIIENGDIDLIR